MSQSAEKFIKLAWRKVLTDEAAQHLCWKGTTTKIPVRALSITSAIKSKYQAKTVPLNSTLIKLYKLKKKFKLTCSKFFIHFLKKFINFNNYLLFIQVLL